MRGIRSLLCLLAFCALPLAAQNNAASQETASQEQTYPVRGIVLNKLTNQPIARALVTMMGGSSDAVLTDSEGRFEFPNVTAGHHFMMARRPGFIGSMRSNMEQRNIQVGPDMADITFALLPTGAISGQLTLSTSDSAENIQVHLLRKNIQNGRAFWQMVQSRMTNSEGVFYFGNLRPGSYRVYTSGSVDPDPAPMDNHPRWGFPPAYFPGGEDATSATALNLGAGQHLQADMLLTQEPLYPVTVSIANRQRGAGVQVYDPAGRVLPYPARYNLRDQAVHLNLPKGTYRLEAESFGMTQLFGSTQITVQGSPVNVNLAVLPLNPIPVTIRRDFTAQSQSPAFSGMISNGQSEWISAGVNLILRSYTGGAPGFFGGNLRHAPNSSDNSSFILENVRPGTYWVQANAFQGYVASISSGGVDLTQQPFVVGPGGSASPMEVTLRNDTATLSISLKGQTTSPASAASTSNNADPLAYISLIPQFSASAQVQENFRMQQATAQMSNLPPGTYRVIAFDSPQELEYDNPDAMRAFAGKGETVTLPPGGTAQVSLDITSTGAGSQ